MAAFATLMLLEYRRDPRLLWNECYFSGSRNFSGLMITGLRSGYDMFLPHVGSMFIIYLVAVRSRTQVKY